MPAGSPYVWNLRSEQTSRAETDSGTENIPTVARQMGGWVRKVEGLRSTSRSLRNSHRDAQRSVGTTVNSIVITR